MNTLRERNVFISFCTLECMGAERNGHKMRIGIASPFNPRFLSDYYDDGTDIPSFYDGATSVNLYVKGLLKLGHEVVVFTFFPQEFFPNGEIYRRIVGKQITVYIMSNKVKDLPLLWLYELPRRAAHLIQTEIDNLDILHAEWTYEYGVAISLFSKRKPIFCSVRDWCPYQRSIQTNKGLQYYWKCKQVWFNRVMRCKKYIYIANSDYTEKQIISAYPEKHIVKIPNPLNSEKILLSRKEQPKDPVFISICQNLEENRKNIKSLCAAFQVYLKDRPMARLILIGKYSATWKKSMETQGLLYRVTLKGNVPYESVFEELDQATCLIHPSLEETFGNIFLEGMCRRIPCIGGQKSGAVSQILGEGKYGVLCDVSRVNDLYSAMKKIEDQDLVERIVNNSTEYIIKTYTETIIAQKHIDLFNSAIHT